MERFDAHFENILREIGDAEGLVEECFSFLCRKTDFFKVKETKEDSGFPDGFAEIFVRDTFRKFQKLAKQKEIGIKDNCTDSEIPIVESVDVESEEVIDNEEAMEETVEKDPQNPEEEPEKPQTDPEKLQHDPDSYNGAVREHYTWSQTIREIDIKAKVPKNIVKGKQVKVTVTSCHLKVELEIDGKWVATIDEDMPYRVVKENATWTLIPGDYVHISLDKTEERWWGKLLASEEEIDLNNINAVRPMDELPDDEQAKIQELMFDEHQKRLGKPTIQQLKMQDILREAWDKEGSPFRGQPFDPTVANFYTA